MAEAFDGRTATAGELNAGPAGLDRGHRAARAERPQHAHGRAGAMRNKLPVLFLKAMLQRACSSQRCLEGSK